jgi:hypothetical protein
MPEARSSTSGAIVEVGKTHPRTNRERLFVVRTKFEMCQHRKWILHRSCQCDQLGKSKVPEANLADGIAMLERSDDVINLLHGGPPAVIKRPIGKIGQTHNISLEDVLLVQTSRRSRRSGDPRTTLRHLRHTCVSVHHGSIFLRILHQY